MAHKRLQSAEDAKEVVQNVFFNLWAKRERLDIHSLPLYLAGMMRFAVYRALSNEQRRADQLRNLHVAGNGAGWATGSGAGRAEKFDFDNRQLLDILTRFSEGLPEKYKIIFIQHKLLDRPLEEVAEQLGVSPRTAEAYVAKVMHIMRQYRQKLALTSFLL